MVDLSRHRSNGIGTILVAIASLICAISLIQLANGFMGTLISIRLASARSDPLVTGMVTAAYFAGYVLGAALCHNFITRVGHIRAFAASAAVVAISFLCHALAFDTVLWAVLRAVAGFGCAALFVTTESWLNVKATSVSRGTVFAVYMVSTYATLGGGQFMINLAPPTSFTLFSVAAILFCLALLLVAMTRAEQPAISSVRHLNAGQLLNAAPVAVVGCFIAGAVNGAFFALVPAFAQANGRSLADISTYMALAILGGLVMQMPVGKLSDRFDRRIVASLVALAFAGVALAIAPARSTAWFPAIWFVFGGFMAVIYPVCVAHANDRVLPDLTVAVSGRLILIFGVGSALGPILGSIAIELLEIRGLFYFMAAAATTFAFFAMTRGMTVERPPFRKSWPFLLLPNIFTQDIAQSSQGERLPKSAVLLGPDQSS